MSLLSSGPSGFHNAPLTKTIIYLSVFLNILASMIGNRRGGTLQFGYEKIVSVSSCWKLLTAPLIFASVGEMLFALTLLYVFRCFERFYGSQKYTVFVVYSFTVSFLFNLFILLLLKGIIGVENATEYLKSGPYGLLFSSIVIYYTMIPATVMFKLSNSFPYTFTEKHVVYLLAVQLLALNFWRALPISMCGLLAGVIYTNYRPLRTLKPPASIAGWFTRHVYPLVNSALLPTNANGNRNRFNRQRQQQIFGQFDAQQQQQQTTGGVGIGGSLRARRNVEQGFADTLLGTPTNDMNADQLQQMFLQATVQQQQQQQQQRQQQHASEENIQTLTSMGFERADVVRALNSTNDNLQEATEMLLAGH